MFQEIDRERALLFHRIGGCERILKTPLPLVHTIKIRRFILLYLLALPIVLASVSFWLAPLITALVAYPLLAIDQIGQELENPFSERRLSHLPLDTICATIESNLIVMLLPQPANPHSVAAPTGGGRQARNHDHAPRCTLRIIGKTRSSGVLRPQRWDFHRFLLPHARRCRGLPRLHTIVQMDAASHDGWRSLSNRFSALVRGSSK